MRCEIGRCREAYRKGAEVGQKGQGRAGAAAGGRGLGRAGRQAGQGREGEQREGGV